MRKAIFAIVVLLVSVQLFCADDLMMFLLVPPSARIASLNSSLVASMDDINAFYNNPATAATQNKSGVAFTHLISFQSITYDFLTIIIPTPSSGVVNLNICYDNFGVQDGRDSSGNLLSTFSNSALILNVGYAYSVNHELSLGVNGKVISEGLNTAGLLIIGLDLGVVYKISDSMAIGEDISNIGTSYNGSNLPLTFKTGFSYKTYPICFLTEIDFDNDGNIVPRLGAEYDFLKIVQLRAGIKFQKDTSNNFSTGFGVTFSDFTVDYALLPFGDLGVENYLTISKRF